MHVRWTIGASKNLEQVHEYIAKNNSVAAINIVLKIITTVESLIDNPAIGRSGRVAGTRELMVSDTPYIVPYRIRGECIEILRILHGAMKYLVN